MHQKTIQTKPLPPRSRLTFSLEENIKNKLRQLCIISKGEQKVRGRGKRVQGSILCRLSREDVSNQVAFDETPEGTGQQASDSLREERTFQVEETAMQRP